MSLPPKHLFLFAFYFLLSAFSTAGTIDPHKFSENARASQLQKINKVKADNQDRFDSVNEILSKMKVDEEKALKALNSYTLPDSSDKSRDEIKISKSRFNWGTKKNHLKYRDVIITFNPSSSIAIVELNNYYNEMGADGWEIGLNEQSIDKSRIIKRIRWRKLK